MNEDMEKMLQEAPAPTLTLEPFAEEKEEPAVVEKEEAVQPVDEKEKIKAILTPQEQKQVDAFVKQIDITNSQMVLQYGASSQKKIADFSESALGNVRTKDLGEIGNELTAVVNELKSIEDGDEEKGFLGLFKKGGNKIANMKAKYAKAEVNVDKICKVLEGHQIQLLKDAAMLDQMYQLNLTYYKELSMYILAGKEKIQQVKEQELPELIKRAEESGLPEDTQKAKDLAELCNRFEKKIYDLELTRTISMQMAPQIRLIQSNDTAMSEKIQSTLVNTIPLWKSQMVLAIGVEHSAQAAKAQREVTDMTNTLLKKNAETLKLATVETAKESERGIVDIETLKQTNETLISTLDEVLQIQEDGRNKRREAEAELTQIETTMRNKLMEMSRTNSSSIIADIECALCEHFIAGNKGKVRWLFGNPKKTERKAEGGAAGSAAHHRAGAAAILYDCADFSEYFAMFSDRRDIADRRNRVFHAWRGACNVPDGRTGRHGDDTVQKTVGRCGAVFFAGLYYYNI